MVITTFGMVIQDSSQLPLEDRQILFLYHSNFPILVPAYCSHYIE
jgi:hypothetical protein